MQRQLIISLIAVLVVSIFAPAISSTNVIAHPHHQTTIAVELNGTGSVEKREISPFKHNGEWITEADCFDVDLIDLSTDEVIGEGTDCLNVVGGNPEDGLQIIGTTIFKFEEGTIVSRGLTSVQPTTHGSPNVSHITGAVSGKHNDIIHSTGAYKGVKGSVRLSGAVDMSRLEDDGKITFSCLFILTLHGEYPNPTDTDGPVMVLNLIGTGRMKQRTITPFDHNGEMLTEADCFDVALMDATNGKRIGSGTDCLMLLGGDGETGLQILGTARFQIRKGNKTGVLVSRGLTSVQPTTHGSSQYTHITGSIPTDNSNDILFGKGDFKGATGQVRLSGAVNMSKLESHGKITFNCLFVVMLDE